ncbi:alpha/beta fold hydrolase [Clostridiales bacterium COT073_COT-073]|nr:alpha/beta fold hydrolase [Clostridiales bacterium COT073_COT-073]
MTQIEERWIEREEGQKNYFRLWNPNLPKTGMVLIISGMTEHIRRYDDFARFLNKQGFLVAAGDHRGQGQTALKNGRLGTLGKGGFRKIVKDQKYYVDMLRKEHPGLPLFLVAHSFGSLICQKFIQQYSDSVDGVVMLGTLKQSRPKALAGRLLLKAVMLVTGEYFNSKIANDMTFFNFNKKFETGFSDFAWICSDLEVVRKYERDPLCGYHVSNNFLHELADGVLQLYNPEQLRQIRKDLPILIMAGGADPLNERGKRIMDLYLMYRKLGIQSVQMKLFDKMRHEVLNEIGKEEAYEQILSFLQQNKKKGIYN